MSTAAKTSAIVSSLFPSAVRDSLLKEQEASSPKRRIKTFVNISADGGDGGEALSNVDVHTHDLVAGQFKSKPLAELYADTTVFFGDIAGFTSWVWQN